jgi:toxin HigB-1
MVRSFRSRALAALWSKNDRSRIRADLIKRVLSRLNSLDDARQPDDMNLPGFNFHRLRRRPIRYSVHINGPWCLTVGWDGEDAIQVDLEQYH